MEHNKGIYMKYAAITSMSHSYYSKSGKAMISTFLNHWQHTMQLFVYNEDNFHIPEKPLTCMGWELGKEYEKFQERHTNSRVKTFAKKGFSIIHAMENIECDRLIWIDADTIIKQPLEYKMMKKICSRKLLSSHFGVWHTKNEKEYHSCETGFFILNKQHIGYDDFCKTYRDIYINNKIETLRRFYDGDVYGKTVDLMKEKKYKMLDLNPGRYKTPISRSILAPFIEHHKAGLKDNIDYSSYLQ